MAGTREEREAVIFVTCKSGVVCAYINDRWHAGCVYAPFYASRCMRLSQETLHLLTFTFSQPTLVLAELPRTETRMLALDDYRKK